MSNKNYNIIESIFNSRTNILNILKKRNFNIEDYENCSFKELAIQYENKQLDLLLHSNENEKKIYIKYYVYKNIKTNNIYDIIEDLFTLEKILTKNDDLIIIIKDEPNETLIQSIKDIWVNDNIYVSLLNIKRLQFNILEHSLVPPHRALSHNEAIYIKNMYNVSDEQLPNISYFSPVSLVMGFRPGDIIEINRKSRTSIRYFYYRICKI
jgi:DNA-directed RNA polymerase subunit H